MQVRGKGGTFLVAHGMTWRREPQSIPTPLGCEDWVHPAIGVIPEFLVLAAPAFSNFGFQEGMNAWEPEAGRVSEEELREELSGSNPPGPMVQPRDSRYPPLGAFCRP